MLSAPVCGTAAQSCCGVFGVDAGGVAHVQYRYSQWIVAKFGIERHPEQAAGRRVGAF